MTNKKAANILILNGSPRKHGNTAVLINWLEEELLQQEYKFTRHNLYELRIKGCSHCNACRKFTSEPGCVLHDDATKILDDITQADIVVMACPIYCWSFPGCLSSLHDRMYCLFKNEIGAKSLLADKKMAGVFTAAGDAFDGMQYCVGALKEMCISGDAEYIGTVGAVKCETPDKLKLRKDAQQEIAALVNKFSKQ